MGNVNASRSLPRVSPAPLGAVRALPWLAGLGAVVGVGALLVAEPLGVFVLFAGGAVLLAFSRLARVRLWQLLTLIGLTGYVVLNYGFANAAFTVRGLPLIVGHLLLFAALLLAVGPRPALLRGALREPAALCLLALVGLTTLHLIYNVPSHGLYAVRDSSLFFEGGFLLLGMAWAREDPDAIALLKWFFVLFLLNFAYTLTFFWREAIQAWSPVAGIFRDVPLLGNYAENAMYLLAGSLFFLWLARRAYRWPRWILLAIAIGQLAAVAVMQVRSIYVALFLVLALLVVLAETKKWVKITATLTLSLAALLLLTSLGDTRLAGRRGPTTLSFLQDQVRGLFLERGAPGTSRIYDRLEWHRQVMHQVMTTPEMLLFGEGFGSPLIEFIGPGGVAVRQPHNTHLTVLARLGLTGLLLWGAFHFLLLRLFVRAFRQRSRWSHGESDLVLWLGILYFLYCLITSVQPFLEFSYGAIPFYFLAGFVLVYLQRRVGEPSRAAAGDRMQEAWLS